MNTSLLTNIEPLISASHIVSKDQKQAKTIEDLLQILVRTVGLDKARVLLPDKEQIYKVHYHCGLTPKELKLAEYHMGEGVTGRVARDRKIALIPDITNEPRFLGRITDLSIFNPVRVSFIAVPIPLQSSRTGVLAVNRLEADAPVLENDLILLQLFAAFIKQALEIHALIEHRTSGLKRENNLLRDKLSGKQVGKDVIGRSPAFLEALERARQSSATGASVLILGESGTGKERLAQFIHNKSQRSEKSFVAINCAAIPENLLESELFGHEKGAFTGAATERVGKFEIADGGTLFLDEIGDMNPDVQTKLLRVLQESEITRLGSNTAKRIDVRIIAATHQDLQRAVEDGRFRLDLYYRLNVISLRLPALRERKSDIPLLAEYFLSRANERYNKQIQFSPYAVNAMKSCRWPGNIRQLENFVERCVILSRVPVIEADVVIAESGNAPGATESLSLPDFQDGRPYRRVEQHSRESIIQSLVEADGNKTLAARRLGLSARQLYYRIRKLDIHPEELV